MNNVDTTYKATTTFGRLRKVGSTKYYAIVTTKPGTKCATCGNPIGIKIADDTSIGEPHRHVPIIVDSAIYHPEPGERVIAFELCAITDDTEAYLHESTVPF